MNPLKYVAASLVVLAGCASPYPSKQVGARVEGNTVSFEGCNFKIVFSGAPKPKPIDIDSAIRNSASRVQMSDILGYSAFTFEGFNFQETALCTCMGFPIEAGATKFSSAESLRSQLGEGLIVTPTNWQEGAVFGKVADFEFRYKSGTEGYGKATYLGNCEGGIVAFNVVDAAKAKAFVESIAPLQVTSNPGRDPTSIDRLRTLEKLRDEKLISDKEYQERRKAIIDAL